MLRLSVGDRVGASVGSKEGLTVGLCVGALEVGVLLGAGVGGIVGTVGAMLGAWLGLSVGLLDVGDKDGSADGARDGLAVGISVAQMARLTFNIAACSADASVKHSDSLAPRTDTNAEGNTPRSKHVAVCDVPEAAVKMADTASAVSMQGVSTPKTQLSLASKATPDTVGCMQDRRSAANTPFCSGHSAVSVPRCRFILAAWLRQSCSVPCTTTRKTPSVPSHVTLVMSPALVGVPVGTSDGVVVGDADGAILGEVVVGERVGDTVVGERVGILLVGDEVGDELGDTVGAPVVGAEDGTSLGAVVGDAIVGDVLGADDVGPRVGLPVLGALVGAVEGEVDGVIVGGCDGVSQLSKVPLA